MLNLILRHVITELTEQKNQGSKLLKDLAIKKQELMDYDDKTPVEDESPAWVSSPFNFLRFAV